MKDPVFAEIAHDADPMDEKHGRTESEELDAVIRRVQLALPDDDASPIILASPAPT